MAELLKEQQIILEFEAIKKLAQHEQPGSVANSEAALRRGAADMFNDVLKITEHVEKIQAMLRDDEEDLDGGTVFDMFAAVRSCATEMATLDVPHKWASACERISRAMCGAADLLSENLPKEVSSSSSTKLPVQAPPGEEATEGSSEKVMKDLESKLLKLQKKHGNKDHPEISGALHDLGLAHADAKEFRRAMCKLQRALVMDRALYGAVYHPEIACHMHTYGSLHMSAYMEDGDPRDLMQARQHLESSLRMKRFLDGDGDHASTADILCKLGVLNGREEERRALAKQQLEEGLRMQRSLQGNKDDPAIAVALHELGHLNQLEGDLTLAKQLLEESLRMKRFLHGDRDHMDTAETLTELGIVNARLKDCTLAKQQLEEALRMQRAMLGDGDHPSIDKTLHELGHLYWRGGDFTLAKQLLEESLRMRRSFDHTDSPSNTAGALFVLGQVNLEAGDLKQAKQHLEESLQIGRTLFRTNAHDDVRLAQKLLCKMSSMGGA